MDIKQQIQKDLRYTYGVGNPKKYLVIHQTGNTRIGANAKAHANLQSRLGVDYSWHWQVDDKEAIQSYLHEVMCWHIGDGRGPGNLTSIGIEICVNEDGNYIQSVKNGAKLAAKILKDENISISNMVQHNYFRQSSGHHKNCPAGIRAGRDGITWNKFKQMVQDELDLLNKPKTNKFFRVFAGSYKDRNNATKLLNELKAKGFKDAFISYEEVDIKPSKKSNEEIAKEVLAGKWGVNPERKKKLEQAGYNYLDIQAIVNRLVK